MKRFTPEEDAIIIAQFPHRYAKDIATDMNRGCGSVMARAKILGLTKYPIYQENDALFERDDILGYICGIAITDGYIHYRSGKARFNLGLNQRDERLVRWVGRTLVTPEPTITYKRKKGTEIESTMATFEVPAPNFVAYCEKLGFGNRKSFTGNAYLKDKSDTFKLYFLRGAIDGDGSVKTDHSEGKVGMSNIQLFSASLAFLHTIQQEFGGSFINDPKKTAKRLNWGGTSGRDLAKNLPVDPWTMERKTERILNLRGRLNQTELSASGSLGVARCKDKKRWEATFVTVFNDKKCTHRVGAFDDVSSATIARQNAIMDFQEENPSHLLVRKPLPQPVPYVV